MAKLTIPVSDEFLKRLKKRSVETGIPTTKATRALLDLWIDRGVEIEIPEPIAIPNVPDRDTQAVAV